MVSVPCFCVRVLVVIMLFLASGQLSAQNGQKWLAAAHQGSVNGMYQTAKNYLFGLEGLPQDNAKALYWAEKGGEQGNVKCMELAITLCLRTSAPDSKCLYWAEKAGEQGSIDAMFQARNIYGSYAFKASTVAEKRKFLEREYYWNEKMLAHPDYDAREQGLEIKQRLEKELEKLNETAITTPAATKPISAAADDGDMTYDTVEEYASFPGGMGACYEWLSRNIQYPPSAAEQGIQGRVFVKFIVNTDGSIEDVRAVRSPDPSLSEEAVRVVKAFPKWTPAKQGGKVVRSSFNLPIMFKLNKPQ